MDNELLHYEAMARFLYKEGNNWMGSGNNKLSVVHERYLNGSVDKDEVDFIEQAFNEANLTFSDLRVRAFKDAARHIKMVDDLIYC